MVIQRKHLRSWGSTLLFWAPTVLLVVAGFWVASRFIEPAPPKSAVIITGGKDGEYYATAQKYVPIFRRNGIDLIVRPSAGSVENYREITKAEGDVDLAIVQGGTLPPEDQRPEEVEGVASLYLEPLWVFYRDGTELTQLGQLKGKRLAVGGEGSGSRALAVKLLDACGVREPDAKLLPLSGAEAAAALKGGTVDGFLLVASPKTAIIRELLATDGVKLMDQSQADGMARNFPYLSAVTLYRGSMDLDHNLPTRDIRLVAPAAVLVAREKSHKSLVLLGAMAATETHSGGDLLAEPGLFPSSKYVELPLAKEAKHFLQSGPSILARTLPFWLASFLERMVILLLPLITLLIPLVRSAPPLYRWRVRARIYKWYRQVQAIDRGSAGETSKESLLQAREELQRIENEVREVRVPLSYMEDLYHLRIHLRLIEDKLKERLQPV